MPTFNLDPLIANFDSGIEAILEAYELKRENAKLLAKIAKAPGLASNLNGDRDSVEGSHGREN